MSAIAKAVVAAGGARGGSQIPLEAEPPVFLPQAATPSELRCHSFIERSIEGWCLGRQLARTECPAHRTCGRGARRHGGRIHDRSGDRDRTLPGPKQGPRRRRKARRAALSTYSAFADAKSGISFHHVRKNLYRRTRCHTLVGKRPAPKTTEGACFACISARRVR